jgi:lipopolysaccharide transport system permease protein
MMNTTTPPVDPIEADIPIITIQPSRGWSSLGLRDVWEYKALLYFLIWREVKGRYRQMAFGPLWIIITPLIQMVIMSFVFGKIARLPSDGVPYPIFTYIALLPWQFFANSVRRSSNSLVEQKGIIAKVYFPRLIIPLAGIASSFIDFLASFVVLLGMMLFYHNYVAPTWPGLLMLPFFLLLAAMTSLAVGLWLAGLSVKYHDVAIAVGFGVTIWQYLTPVAYSISLVPEQWQLLYKLNPMTTVIEGFRWALLGTSPPPDWTAIVNTLVVFVLLIFGAYYFRRTERTIVDVI